MKGRGFKALWACLLGLLSLLACAREPVLRVGVKRDVPLWGEFNGRELVGLEPDLARELGRALGRRVELVGLNTAERLKALNDRQVDLLIATLSDTPERRAQWHLVLPHYYSSGVNVLVQRNDQIRRWEDLRQRRACARQGAFYNRPIMLEFGLELIPLFDNHWAQKSMQLGRCDAWLHDDTALIAILRDPSWAARFEMPLPSRLNAPWSIAMRKDQAGSELARLISKEIARWHQEGVLIQLEKRWGIPPSAFTREMHARWRQGEGAPAACTWPITPETPEPCL
jgi:polar amino acid transport system substrate-binding protein